MKRARQYRACALWEDGQRDVTGDELMVGRVDLTPAAAGVQPERRISEQPRCGALGSDEVVSLSVPVQARSDEPGDSFGTHGVSLLLEGCDYAVDDPFHVGYEL